jgi:hypothetical protein
MKFASETSVIIAGALVAAAILFTNHWAFAWGDGASYRLNRWTGTIVMCPPKSRDRASIIAGGMGYACEPPAAQP